MRALPSKGMRYFMGRWREAWIVDDCILKVATPLRESNLSGEDVDLARDVIISLIHFIRNDFPVLAVPCIIILKGGKIFFFPK